VPLGLHVSLPLGGGPGRGSYLRIDDRVARGLMHFHRETPALEALLQKPDLVVDALAGKAHRGDADGIEEGAHECVGALADEGVDHGPMVAIRAAGITLGPWRSSSVSFPA